MTTVYFVRHCEPDYKHMDDRTRPLTEKGLKDRALVTRFLEEHSVQAVLSSPFRRAFDTVAQFAEKHRLPVRVVEDFRERKVSDTWFLNYEGYAKSQWDDFEYHLPNGECLREVQERNIAALNGVLQEYKDQVLAIGSHGTALSTIVNYYDKSFAFEGCFGIRTLMPWVVELVFDGNVNISIRQFDLFKNCILK